MTDVSSSTVPLVCGIEVKDTGGDKNEAIAQLAIWSITGLRHVKKMTGLPAIKLLPFVGWTVIGHRWDLYITWLKSDDGVVFGERYSPPARHRMLVFSRYWSFSSGWINGCQKCIGLGYEAFSNDSRGRRKKWRGWR